MYPIVSISELEKHGDVQLLRGSGISKKDFNNMGKFPCIHYGDLYTLYTPIIQEVLRKTNVEGKIKSLEGDVLVPATTTADAMGIAIARALDKEGVIIGGDINIIRTRNNVLLSSYLSYMINFPLKHQLAQYAKGVNILHVNNNDIRMLRIPVPPIQEQKSIVEKTTKLFANIDKVEANAEQNLINAKELFDGYLENIVAQKDKLGKYIKITTGKLNSNAAVENGQYPFFTCSRTPLRINNFAFDCEAILLAGNNASGDFNVKHYKGKFNAYQRTYVITIPDKSKLNYRYLYFQLFKALAELKKMSLGANTKFLRVGMITDFMLSMPTIEVQQKIVEKLDALQEQTKQVEAIYTQKIKECDELKQSILQKAFRGEL